MTLGRGKAWEVQLEVWHRQYRADSLAVVHHAHPPVKRGRFVGKAPPDFFGVVAGGVGVLFDAKATTALKRWPLANIKPHQARDLEAWWQRGAHSFIALDWSGSRWMLPWGVLQDPYWEWRHNSGRAHLTRADLPLLGVEMDEDGWINHLICCSDVRPG